MKECTKMNEPFFFFLLGLEPKSPANDINDATVEVKRAQKGIFEVNAYI